MEYAPIQHTVAFRLNPDADVANFFERANQLASIDGVHNFEILRQVGTKSPFTHGLSMCFDSQHAYHEYNAHPQHLAFVEEDWTTNVAEFSELDYVRGTHPTEG